MFPPPQAGSSRCRDLLGQLTRGSARRYGSTREPSANAVGGDGRGSPSGRRGGRPRTCAIPGDGHSARHRRHRAGAAHEDRAHPLEEILGDLGLCRVAQEVEGEIDRLLSLLRDKISQRGFTQMEVQDALGWGRSYISQLLTKQKSARIDQVLAILRVIGVEPQAFFAELYGPAPGAGQRRRLPAPTSRQLPAEEPMRTHQLIRGLVDVLLSKGLISRQELSKAVEAQQREERI